MTPLYLGGTRVRPIIGGNRFQPVGAVASGGSSPALANVYWGARIDGQHYVDTSRTADGTDPPFASGNWDLFETDAARKISVLHWGTGGSEWPWGGIGASTSGLVRSRGAFSHYSMSTSCLFQNGFTTGSSGTSGLRDLLELANNYVVTGSQPATTAGDAAKRAIASLEAIFGSGVNSITSRGYPTMIRPFWEFNGSWFPWGTSAISNGSSTSNPVGNSPEWGPTFTTLSPTGAETRIVSHIAVWRMLVRAAHDAHAGVPIGTNAAGGTGGSGGPFNTGPITFCWCPNSVTSPASGGVANFAAWWPGSSFVHWTGADIYPPRNTEPYPYISTNSLWTPTYNALLALAPDKPMFIAELGFWDNTQSPGKAQQVTDLLTSYIPSHPLIKGFTWFQQSAAEPGVFIETEPAAKTAFQTGINDISHGVNYLAAPVQGVNLSKFASGLSVPDPANLTPIP